MIPTEMYLECGRVHTDKDEEVDCATVAATQKLLNGHVSCWLKMTNMGERHEHECDAGRA